jgi:hypothetical protein
MADTMVRTTYEVDSASMTRLWTLQELLVNREGTRAHGIILRRLLERIELRIETEAAPEHQAVRL